MLVVGVGVSLAGLSPTMGTSVNTGLVSLALVLADAALCATLAVVCSGETAAPTSIVVESVGERMLPRTRHERSRREGILARRSLAHK